MSWWMFGASVGLSLLGNMGSHQAAAKEAAARKKLQEYNNKMAHISDAMNQNAITTNVTQQIQKSAREAHVIQKKAMELTGAVDVQSASSQTVGRSVDLVMKDVARGAAQSEYTRSENLKAFFLQADQQRRQSALSAKMNEDHTYIPEPSAGMALLNVAKDALGAWGSAFPNGINPSGSGGGGGIAPGSYGKMTGQGDTQTLLMNKYAKLFK